jgi:hypothetical protein
VNRLETELAGKLQIISLNVNDPVGRRIADRFDFGYTPTFIFCGKNGIEQWRSVGTLDAERVRKSLTSP